MELIIMRKQKKPSVITKIRSKDREVPISIANLFFKKDKSNKHDLAIANISRYLNIILLIIVFINKLLNGIKIFINMIIFIWSKFN
jgi:hypothetical protein